MRCPTWVRAAEIDDWAKTTTAKAVLPELIRRLALATVDLREADFRLYKAMKRWNNEVGDMLAYVNDKLVPHGFDEIVKDDFAALRQLLQRHR